MTAIKVNITRYISQDQPGFVECEFTDAQNKIHRVYEKVPVVAAGQLDANSLYPQQGFIRCTLVKSWKNNDGHQVFTVNTEDPLDIMSTEGLQMFDVFDHQVVRQ